MYFNFFYDKMKPGFSLYKNFPANQETKKKYEPSYTAIQKHFSFAGSIDPINKILTAQLEIQFISTIDKCSYIELDAKELLIEKVLYKSYQQEVYTECKFTHSNYKLKIDLINHAKPLTHGDTFYISIAYQVRNPRKGLFFISKDHSPESYDCIWTQGQDTDTPFWLPCQDNPKLKITADFSLTYPSHWEMESNGILKETHSQGDTKSSRWILDKPHSPYLMAVAGGDLCRFETQWRGKPISICLGKPFKDLGISLLEMTKSMMEMYSNFWEFEYPWDKYSQVFVKNFPFGGMENTALTINSDRLLGLPNLIKTQDFYSYVIMHELAHQWFGDYLTCETWAEGWLNESFATHSELLYEEWKNGEISGIFYNELTFRSRYLSESQEYQRPIVTNSYEYPTEIFDAHLYEKGGMILNQIRYFLGPKQFSKAVNRYLRENPFGSVNTVDFVRALEAETGWNPRSYLDQFIHSSGHCELDVTYSFKTEAEKKLELKIIQKQDGPSFHFETQFTLVYENGILEDKTISIEQKEVSLSFPVNNGFLFAVLDSRGTTVGTCNHNWTSSDALKILRESNNGFWKFLATKSLFSQNPSEDQVEAIFQWLSEEPLRLARTATQGFLGSTEHPQAYKILSKLKEDDPVVNKTLFLALANCCPPKEQKNYISQLFETLNDLNTLPGHMESALKALMILSKRSIFLKDESFRKKLVKICYEHFEKSSPFSVVEVQAAKLLGSIGTWDECEVLRREVEKGVNETPWPKILGSLEGLALLVQRFADKAMDARPYFLHWSKEWHPIQIPGALPSVWLLSKDQELVGSLENWIHHYKDYGHLIPSARRILSQFKLLSSRRESQFEKDISMLKEKIWDLEKRLNSKTDCHLND